MLKIDFQNKNNFKSQYKNKVSLNQNKEILYNSQFNSNSKALDFSSNYRKSDINFKGCFGGEKSNLSQIHKLIHFTHFFREPGTDEFVQDYIRKHFSSQRRINIVSGACSCGDEARSYSMMLDDLEDKVTIYGFDIDKNVIKRANNSNSVQLIIHSSMEKNRSYTENMLVRRYMSLTPYERKCRNKFHEYYSVGERTVIKLNETQENTQSSSRFQSGYLNKYNCNARKKIENCRFKQGDVLNLSKLYKPDSVDVLLYRNALYHSLCKTDNSNSARKERFDAREVMDKIAKEINKVVKKGGLVVFGENEDRQGTPWYIVVNAMKKNGFVPIVNSPIQKDNLFMKVENINSSIWGDNPLI